MVTITTAELASYACCKLLCYHPRSDSILGMTNRASLVKNSIPSVKEVSEVYWKDTSSWPCHYLRCHWANHFISLSLSFILKWECWMSWPLWFHSAQSPISLCCIFSNQLFQSFSWPMLNHLAHCLSYTWVTLPLIQGQK